MTAAQIEYYTAAIKAVLTAGGNFAHVEIDGDGTLIAIWGDDKACATIVEDTAPRRVKTVYRKAIVYVRADIEYTDETDLQNQLEEFKNNVSVDLDNAPGGNYDYEFTYDGLSKIPAEEVPDWLFD